MGYRRIVFIAAAFTIAAWAGVRATGDELISKESLSKEPFGDLQPFDLSKRSPATNNTDAKKSETAKRAPQSNNALALQRNPRVADDVFKVNLLGDPECIVFEGVKLFPEQKLRLALACDLKYQAAARPSNDTSNFLEVLEKRLLEGYLNSGCPDAKVQATQDGKRQAVIVHVDEGQLFRKGQVFVAGAKVISAQAIQEFLTRPQPVRPWTYILEGNRLDIFAKEENKNASADDETTASSDSDSITIWKSGEPIDFRRIDNSQLERGIQFALAELGYPATPFHIELERNEKQGLANLRISILKEMPRAVATDIEIYGLKRDSREALLKYLKLKPGDALTEETLKRLDERLTNSCRYWTHKIEVSTSSPPNHDSPQPQTASSKLVLKLEEFTATPPLGEPLSAVDDTMIECADWLNSLAKDFGPRDLVVTTAAADLGGLLQHAQLVLAPDGTTALDLQMATDDWRIDHSAIVGPRGIELYDWKHNDKFCDSRQIWPIAQLLVAASHTEDGEQRLGICFGYAIGNSAKESSPPRFPIKIRAEPVAMLRFIHDPQVKTESHNSILTVKEDELELQVDESTGAIQSLKCAGFSTAGISAVDFRSKEGLAARMIEKIQRRGNDFQNQFDEKNPLGSAATYAIQQIERQPSIQGKPKQRIAWQMLDKVSTSDAFRNLTRLDTYPKLAAGSTKNTFEIPGHAEFTGGNWEEFVCSYTPFLADKAFPRGSWPWTLSRELSFRTLAHEADDDVVRHNHRLEIEEYERAATHSGTGPLGRLVFVSVLQATNPTIAVSEHSTSIADRSLTELSDEAFLKDVHLISEGGYPLALLYREAVEKFGQLGETEQREFINMMPQSSHDALNRLAARRKQAPNESVGESINRAFLESWQNGLRETIESGLQRSAQERSRESTTAQKESSPRSE